MASKSQTFLGFDFSTQQLKVVAVNDDLQVVYEDSVIFDDYLSEFKTSGGVHASSDGFTVTSPTLMWVKALDIILKRMKESQTFQLNSVSAISGAGQQHGSVYWANGSRHKLQQLSPQNSLYENFTEKTLLSLNNSPIWMDSSTREECRELENAVGGPHQLLELTGSRAFERFTGPQICKIHKRSKEVYHNTEHISLVSSFAASLFIGDYAPIDWADASGMNLMNIRTKAWCELCLQVCGEDLSVKLGTPVPAHQIIGSISNYMSDQYGFNADCQVITFTGDNPASLAGLRLKENDLIISLGTSDTVFLWLTEPKMYIDGHVFANPIDSSAYMGLLCYKNGSLTRERIRDEFADQSWETFDRLLRSTPPGNNGHIGIYYDKPEITPSNIVGCYRFNANDDSVTSFTRDVEIRAVIEGQFLAKRCHAEKMGYKLYSCQRILATGGASANKAILQILADVFSVPVFTLSSTSSAALGSAYRAKYGLMHQTAGQTFNDVVSSAPEFKCVAIPDRDLQQVYNDMASRYDAIEKNFIKI